MKMSNLGTIGLCSILILCQICSGSLEEVEKENDLHSVMQHNPMDLKDVHNTTKSEHCAPCHTQEMGGNLESLKEAAVVVLEKNNFVSKGKSCPYPFTEVVYECFYAHRKKLTWIQAKQVCRGMGGDLAEPEHLYALQAHLADTYGPSYFWIGGSDLDHEGTWLWISGKPIDADDWLFARPDNLGGDEHCLEIVMSDYPRLLNDETCSVMQRFICQYRH